MSNLRGIMLSLMFILALLVPSAIQVASIVSAQTQEMPRVALVKLWGISHTAYMAKFIGEDYIAVFESHGDASLDGKYAVSYTHLTLPTN